MTTAAIRAGDTRTRIAQTDAAGELVRVRERVDPALGIATVMRALSQLPRVPAVYFESIKGHPDNRAIALLFSDFARTLRLCGLPEQSVRRTRR